MIGKNIVQDVQNGFVFPSRRVDDHMDARVGRGHGKQLLYGSGHDGRLEHLLTLDW
jgi:hypothetical protein